MTAKKLIMIDCPSCFGEGRTETLTRLTYAGDQTWRIRRCEKCDGSGKIEVEEEEVEEDLEE